MSTVVDRKRKQSLECSTFLLQVRFMAADAKVALQRYVQNNSLLMKTPLSKQQVKEIFFKYRLEHLPRKGVDELAEFLFFKALKNGYLVKVPKIRPIAHFAGWNTPLGPISTGVLRDSNVSEHKSTVENAQ